MKLDILAIGAHPDDVELGCGGTLAKMYALNKKIGILDLTQGELGTRGTAETRKNEAIKAAEILKIDIRENLKYRDGFFLNDEEHILGVIKMIRKYQPEIILTNTLEDRHPDHGKASELVLKSCFLSGLIKVQTDYEGHKQEKWRPKHVFHYIQWNEVSPDFIIDISEYLDTKVEACLAYETQFYKESSDKNIENIQKPETPIASKNFKESIIYRAKNMGRLIGTEAGEGFVNKSYLGLKDFNSII